MQATQSSTASGAGSGSSQFAALRSVSRSLLESLDERTKRCRTVAAFAGVAERAGLAHDVGNLLGALGLYADLMMVPGVLRDEYRQYADELRLLSDRSQELVGRLMQHAESDLPDSRPERVVLPQVVGRCHGLLRSIAGWPVETEFGAGSRCPVVAPAVSVERILTNLVKNAGEALARKGSDDGIIRISVEAVEKGAVPRLVLTVADTGCGMSEEELLRLEEGVRLARSGGAGGLGLRVVRELAALSGGGVGIERRAGMGTSVTVEWDGVVQRHEERPMRLVEAEAGWIAC